MSCTPLRVVLDLFRSQPQSFFVLSGKNHVVFVQRLDTWILIKYGNPPVVHVFFAEVLSESMYVGSVRGTSSEPEFLVFFLDQWSTARVADRHKALSHDAPNGRQEILHLMTHSTLKIQNTRIGKVSTNQKKLLCINCFQHDSPHAQYRTTRPSIQNSTNMSNNTVQTRRFPGQTRIYRRNRNPE